MYSRLESERAVAVVKNMTDEDFEVCKKVLYGQSDFNPVPTSTIQKGILIDIDNQEFVFALLTSDLIQVSLESLWTMPYRCLIESLS